MVRPLGADLVAGEAVHGLFESFAEERVEGTGEQLGFEAAQAAEVPGGVEELGKGDLLERPTRVDLFDQGGLEFFELVPFVVTDDEFLGGTSSDRCSITWAMVCPWAVRWRGVRCARTAMLTSG